MFLGYKSLLKVSCWFLEWSWSLKLIWRLKMIWKLLISCFSFQDLAARKKRITVREARSRHEGRCERRASKLSGSVRSVHIVLGLSTTFGWHITTCGEGLTPRGRAFNFLRNACNVLGPSEHFARHTMGSARRAETLIFVQSHLVFRFDPFWLWIASFRLEMTL